jgi:pantetheine-phosphate adenylyltransferase
VGDKTGTEIVVHPFENLLIDCARDVGAGVIIRGLRAVADFEYEYQMVGMNRAMDSSIETVFLMAEARHQAIASKLVKEIARLGGDITKFVPASVKEALIAKLARK